MEIKSTQNSQKHFEKNKVGGLLLPYFKVYSKVRIIKIV